MQRDLLFNHLFKKQQACGNNMQNKMKDRIKFYDLENHLNEWFGHDWNNQSSTQILAMTMNLLDKVGVEILSDEDD